MYIFADNPAFAFLYFCRKYKEDRWMSANSSSPCKFFQTTCLQLELHGHTIQRPCAYIWEEMGNVVGYCRQQAYLRQDQTGTCSALLTACRHWYLQACAPRDCFSSDSILLMIISNHRYGICVVSGPNTESLYLPAFDLTSEAIF